MNQMWKNKEGVKEALCDQVNMLNGSLGSNNYSYVHKFWGSKRRIDSRMAYDLKHKN